jgi:hypothetical protein
MARYRAFAERMKGPRHGFVVLATMMLVCVCAQSADARVLRPAVTVEGHSLKWEAIAGTTEYQVKAVVDRKATISETSATTLTPAVDPGHSVVYRVRAWQPAKSAWSRPVTVTYQREVIIGINDGSASGPADAKQFVARGITSERLEAPGTQGETGSTAELLKRSEGDGFSDDVVIVGNTRDEEPLSAVNVPAWTAASLKQVEEAAGNGAKLLEVGNEMFLKGSRCNGCYQQAEPARYAEMFVSLSKAVEAAGVKGVTLLFDSYGDYREYEGGPWSKLCCGGGWLAAAVKAEPELLARVGDFSMHPYGEAGTNKRNDLGPDALKAEREQAVSLGFANTSYYVTEYGVKVPGATTASSLNLQAERIRAAYTEMIGFGYVLGIWYFESHDDITGRWGLIENQKSAEAAFIARPSLEVVADFALGV